MFDRLKRALVESFVGAIALGWLFAQGILHFADIFIAPLAVWVQRIEYPGVFESRGSVPAGLSFLDAVPQLVQSLLLLLVAYVLLRWL